MSEEILNKEVTSEPEVLKFAGGLIAQRFQAEGLIRIFNQDGFELFRFGSGACPWTPEPIQFLIDIYRVGFDRGRVLGRDITKQRLREVLGPEL